MSIWVLYEGGSYECGEPDHVMWGPVDFVIKRLESDRSMQFSPDHVAMEFNDAGAPTGVTIQKVNGEWRQYDAAPVEAA